MGRAMKPTPLSMPLCVLGFGLLAGCAHAADVCEPLREQIEVQIAATGAATPEQCEAVERFAFYERVKGAYAIVQTGEMQPYANFLFKKGVISEPLAD